MHGCTRTVSALMLAMGVVKVAITLALVHTLVPPERPSHGEGLTMRLGMPGSSHWRITRGTTGMGP